MWMMMIMRMRMRRLRRRRRWRCAKGMFLNNCQGQIIRGGSLYDLLVKGKLHV